MHLEGDLFYIPPPLPLRRGKDKEKRGRRGEGSRIQNEI
jgi:hypothetical protein